MPVSAEQALLASKHISAVAYVETASAYVSKAVPEAFELAAQAALGLLNSKKNIPKKVRHFRSYLTRNGNVDLLTLINKIKTLIELN